MSRTFHGGADDGYDPDTSRNGPLPALARQPRAAGADVAAKLCIADHLADGPKTSGELTTACSAHPGALYRLLRVLAGFDVFAEDEQGYFTLTPMAALLQQGPANSKRAFALWSGGVSYELFGSLDYSVMTGEPAFDHLFGMEFFDYLDHHPEVGTLFDEFMACQTGPMGSVVADYDFSGVETVVDVAGGRGEVLAAILRAHPSLLGVLIDRPRVVQAAKCVLERAGVTDRCQTVCGDVSESVPSGGDLYILKSVVHGLDDEGSAHLIANCRRAMNTGGRNLLVEFVMSPGNDPFPGKLMDLLMLVGSHGGRERTEQEFRELYTAAGCRLTSITASKYVHSLIEAVAA